MGCVSWRAPGSGNPPDDAHRQRALAAWLSRLRQINSWRIRARPYDLRSFAHTTHPALTFCNLHIDERKRTWVIDMWTKTVATQIVVIKAAHSVIFLVNCASIVHILWTGLTGRRSRWTRPALVAALVESVVFVGNRGHCPLTGMVERLGAQNGRVSDIFLPRWFADRIPLIFGPMLVIGLALMAWRHRAAAGGNFAAQQQRV